MILGLCYWFTMDNLMLAVGVSMAYHLCLCASEYASKTKIPHPEFQCSDAPTLVPSTFMHKISRSRVTLIKFMIRHAKNICTGYGIPICFTTEDVTGDALAFPQFWYTFGLT